MVPYGAALIIKGHAGLMMGFGAPTSMFGYGRPILKFSTIFCEMLVHKCPNTIYLSASKCLRGQACSLIPHSKPHFRSW
jgi:hypothetical protein